MLAAVSVDTVSRGAGPGRRCHLPGSTKKTLLAQSHTHSCTCVWLPSRYIAELSDDNGDPEGLKASNVCYLAPYRRSSPAPVCGEAMDWAPGVAQPLTPCVTSDRTPQLPRPQFLHLHYVWSFIQGTIEVNLLSLFTNTTLCCVSPILSLV